MTTKCSIAIATYRREQVLVDTIHLLLALTPAPDEIIVVDQTEEHTEPVRCALERLNAEGSIRWIQLETPSIPKAMNRALLAAKNELVLFLDDDVRPEPELFAAHLNAHEQTRAALVAGRVIQPNQEGIDFSRDEHFHFASTRAAWIDHFMGGNFSVCRAVAIAIGGFDECFVSVAYNFEIEFAYRLARTGYRIYFEPKGCIHHLAAKEGGTRSYGSFLTTVKPDHAVGIYYCLFRTWSGWCSFRQLVYRPFRAVITRHHLKRPWQIPISFFAQLWAVVWAVRLVIRGPQYVSAHSTYSTLPSRD